ncbi:MAG: pilus assembly protein [Bdellovibrio sp. ArHS]|uniref:type II and III secretion system protein n=1 Tax=Bdellovibrio sp. ArHS TaxID=1569284 RepID=UPI0005829CD9|nr:type II and III secretion system protein [Bdellovibrio sp. ArHS]KHD89141.1 MAG: pilus assembly protein [Bdellovibrio sp. ArHS]
MKTLLILVVTFFFSVAGAKEKELTLSLGETHKIPLQGHSSVWIQDREILKAEGQGASLTLRGTREGHTLLRVGSAVYRVQVLHPTKTDSLALLQQELQSVVGLSVLVSEGDLHIVGSLYRFADWHKLAAFSRDRSLGYKMRAQFSDELKAAAQSHFRTVLAEAKLPPQTLIFSQGIEVRISSSEDVLKKYVQLLGPYGIHVLRDENSLEVAPTVKVQITVAEIRRAQGMKYGLQWPSSYAANLLPSGTWEVEAGLPFNIQALEENGDGRILASPNILCRSGKEAEFLAGGEFPIRIMSYKASEVVWKRYGILLRVKPKADSSGRISLSIETEVTTLDKANGTGDIPGVLTNRVSSHFDLTRPQTIALSGLLKNEEGTSSSGLPLFSRLPVLGALFSSKDFRENRSELVIFVRPTILKDGEDGTGQEHLQTQGVEK